MSRRAYGTSPAVAVMVVVASLLCAPFAMAVFNSRANGGPLLLSTSSLTPPTAVTATLLNCRRKSVELNISWSASKSAYATAYVVEQAPKSSGPFVALATVPTTQTSYSDTAESTTYPATDYYRVTAQFRSWSASSISTQAKACSGG